MLGFYSNNLIEMGILLLGTLIVIFAEFKVKGAYSKYLGKKSSKDLAGCEVARKILDDAGLEQIHVVEVKGVLTDHYDPKNKVVRLSTDIFHGTSIAAVSVAAHECGHAIQDKDNYSFMRIRSLLIPSVNFITKIGYFASIIGLIFGLFDLAVCGIIVLFATLVFQLVTLPVEFDASKRAKKIIDKLDLATKSEQEGVESMLSAAAFTYVASVINTLLQMLRLLINILNRRD